MTDWSAKRAQIAAKIAEQGGPATIMRTTSVYDKRADKTVETATAIPCFAFLGNEEATDEQGRLINHLIATLTEEAKSEDKVIFGGQTYTVAKSVVIAPAGVPILFSAVLNT